MPHDRRIGLDRRRLERRHQPHPEDLYYPSERGLAGLVHVVPLCVLSWLLLYALVRTIWG